MNILKNGKIRLAFDKKGFIKSLKYGDKEYISRQPLTHLKQNAPHANSAIIQ